MAEHLKVDAAQTICTSQVVAGDAEELRAELARIAREWDDVSSGWSGTAAAAFASLWEEWYDGAAKLVETLAKSSQLLERAAVKYDDQETTSARSLRDIRAAIDL